MGSYNCSCNVGYTLANDRHGCTSKTTPIGISMDIIVFINLFHHADIDECTLGTDACTQICYDTPGSYRCCCNSGYILDSDGRTCNGIVAIMHQNELVNVEKKIDADVDECTIETDLCDQNCFNTIGGYTCSCNAGYTLSGNYTCLSKKSQ